MLWSSDQMVWSARNLICVTLIWFHEVMCVFQSSFDGDSRLSSRIWNGLRYDLYVFILITSDAHNVVLNALLDLRGGERRYKYMWVFLTLNSFSLHISYSILNHVFLITREPTLLMFLRSSNSFLSIIRFVKIQWSKWLTSTVLTVTW